MKKLCPRCQKTLPLTEFHKDRSRPLGVFAYCKKCNTKHARKWVLQNREKARDYFRAYVAQNAEAMTRYRKKYVKANPEVQRNHTRIRRARKRANTLNIPTVESINMRMQECGAACVYCGGIFSHVDHVVALSRGGSDDVRNLVPACGNCNYRKNAKEWVAWFKRQHFYSPEREATIRRLLAPA